MQAQIKELKNHWNVTYIDGKLTLSYQIDKELCPDRESVMQYLKEQGFQGKNHDVE